MRKTIIATLLAKIREMGLRTRNVVLSLLFMVLTFLLVQADEAHAIIFVDWDVTNSGSVFGPTDPVPVMGTLFNLGTSTENLTNTNLSGASRSTVPSPAGTYSGIFGPGPVDNFWTQFVGLNLTPGGSFNFVHATYTPSGPTPAGVYSTPTHTIFFTHPSGTISPSGINRSFSWTVRESVPEPATLLLLGSGLVGLGVFRKKFRKK